MEKRDRRQEILDNRYLTLKINFQQGFFHADSANINL